MRGDFSEGRFLVIAPELNLPMQGACRRYVGHFMPLADQRAGFTTVTLEAFIAALHEHGDPSYADALFRRYCDWSLIGDEIEANSLRSWKDDGWAPVGGSACAPTMLVSSALGLQTEGDQLPDCLGPGRNAVFKPPVVDRCGLLLSDHDRQPDVFGLLVHHHRLPSLRRLHKFVDIRQRSP
nr:hypothetical protein [Sphingomonas faeni]